MEIKGYKKAFFGVRKDDGEYLYITKPSWDCGWYWSFGYIGNRFEHHHLDSYATRFLTIKDDKGEYHHINEMRNISMHDALLEDYNLSMAIEAKLWQFCELSQTIYSLKKTAAVLGRGGSHVANNPCADTIKNPDEVRRINEIVLPELLQIFWDLVSKQSEDVKTVS